MDAARQSVPHPGSPNYHFIRATYMRVFSTRSRRRAQSIIETVVGIIFLIPIVLFLFDVGVLLLANTANDNLAKQAARAAASAHPEPPPADPLANVGQYKLKAEKAAGTGAGTEGVIDRYATSSKSTFMTNIRRAAMFYNGDVVGTTDGGLPSNANPGLGNVSVTTSMSVQVPVPFPGFDTKRTFYARAVEPIVALPPQ